MNAETIIRYSTDLETNESFYTDNAIELRPRRKHGDRIEINYYPCPTTAILRDRSSNSQFTLLTRQSVGATSLRNGELEVMVQRSLGQDDGRGLGEAMMDSSTITPKFMIIVASVAAAEKIRGKLATLLHNPPVLLFGESDSHSSWDAKNYMSFFPMERPFPGKTENRVVLSNADTC